MKGRGAKIYLDTIPKELVPRSYDSEIAEYFDLRRDQSLNDLALTRNSK